jgi:hypothetical protein
MDGRRRPRQDAAYSGVGASIADGLTAILSDYG